MSLLPKYFTPQQTVSADPLYNHAPHRKALGETTNVYASLCLFAFLWIRRGTFTQSGGDNTRTTKQNTKHTSRYAAQADGSYFRILHRALSEKLSSRVRCAITVRQKNCALGNMLRVYSR